MHLPPQLARPTECVLNPRFRPCSSSGRHSGPAFARAFRRLYSSSTIPFRIRTYVEHTRKPRRIRTYAKTGGGGLIIVN